MPYSCVLLDSLFQAQYEDEVYLDFLRYIGHEDFWIYALADFIYSVQQSFLLDEYTHDYAQNIANHFVIYFVQLM